MFSSKRTDDGSAPAPGSGVADPNSPNAQTASGTPLGTNTADAPSIQAAMNMTSGAARSVVHHNAVALLLGALLFSVAPIFIVA